MHRKVATRDHKLVYWFAGVIAASSVLLEKKARRAELALYVLPRAADSLWYILNKRHLIPNIKNTEVSLSLFLKNLTVADKAVLSMKSSLQQFDSTKRTTT